MSNVNKWVWFMHVTVIKGIIGGVMHKFILGSLFGSFRCSPDSTLEGQHSAVKNVSNELNENESNTFL